MLQLSGGYAQRLALPFYQYHLTLRDLRFQVDAADAAFRCQKLIRYEPDAASTIGNIWSAVNASMAG